MITDYRVFPVGYITNLLNKLTWEFEQKCPYTAAREEINIYTPRILLAVLREEMDQRVYVNLHLPLDRPTFLGYNILPGYDYGKIIIAHERYPETNDSRYYHSVDVVEYLKDKPKN
jgi:hypothetical protein